MNMEQPTPQPVPSTTVIIGKELIRKFSNEIIQSYVPRQFLPWDQIIRFRIDNPTELFSVLSEIAKGQRPQISVKGHGEFIFGLDSNITSIQYDGTTLSLTWQAENTV